MTTWSSGFTFDFSYCAGITGTNIGFTVLFLLFDVGGRKRMGGTGDVFVGYSGGRGVGVVCVGEEVADDGFWLILIGGGGCGGSGIDIIWWCWE